MRAFICIMRMPAPSLKADCPAYVRRIVHTLEKQYYNYGFYHLIYFLGWILVRYWLDY